jgi:hypothetical protein
VSRHILFLCLVFSGNLYAQASKGQKFLWPILLDFLDERHQFGEEVLRAAIAGDASTHSFKQFYESASRGKLRVELAKVTRYLVEEKLGEIPNDASCVAKRKTWMQNAIRSVKRTESPPPNSYFMVFYPKGLPCSFGALGYVNSNVTLFHSKTESPSVTTLIHEFGHNLGFHHARSYIDGKFLERGDDSDRMGARAAAMEFNAPHLVRAKWLDPQEQLFIHEAGTQEILCLESACQGALPKVLLYVQSNGWIYYLSYRRALGKFGADLPAKYDAKLSIHVQRPIKEEPFSASASIYLLRVLSVGEIFQSGDLQVKFLESPSEQSAKVEFLL